MTTLWHAPVLNEYAVEHALQIKEKFADDSEVAERCLPALPVW